jgi:hypothetical protein
VIRQLAEDDAPDLTADFFAGVQLLINAVTKSVLTKLN